MAILVRMKKTGRSVSLPASQARGLVAAGLAVPVAPAQPADADQTGRPESAPQGVHGDAGGGSAADTEKKRKAPQGAADAKRGVGAGGKRSEPKKAGYSRRDMRAED